MSASRRPPPLGLTAGPSRRLTGLLLGIHGLAAAVLLVLPAAPVLRLAGVAATGLSLLWSLRLHAWRRSPRALVAARRDEQGAWWLTRADGRVLPARLLGDSFVSVPLVILNFRTGRFLRRSLVLFPDALDGTSLRRLRVRLYLDRPGAAG